MNQPGLARISSELVEIVRQSDLGARRRILERACALAVDRTGLEDSTIADALEALGHAVPINRPLVSQVDALTEQLDDAAWDLQDRVEGGTATKHEYDIAFANARASAAVGFAIQDSLSSAFDALYEAYYAIGDSSDEFVRYLIT